MGGGSKSKAHPTAPMPNGQVATPPPPPLRIGRIRSTVSEPACISSVQGAERIRAKSQGRQSSRVSVRSRSAEPSRQVLAALGPPSAGVGRRLCGAQTRRRRQPAQRGRQCATWTAGRQRLSASASTASWRGWTRPSVARNRGPVGRNSGTGRRMRSGWPWSARPRQH